MIAARFGTCVGFLILCGTVAAQPPTSENAAGLAAPQPGVHRPVTFAPTSQAAPTPTTPPTTEVATWTGPRVQLGYGRLRLKDGFGEGQTHLGTFSGFAPTGRVRVAGTGVLGSRVYALGQNDFVLGVLAHAGYQHLSDFDRLVPYVTFDIGGGASIGKRFRETQSHGWLLFGLTAGVEVRLSRGLHLGIGFGYARVRLDGVGHHTASLDLHVGL